MYSTCIALHIAVCEHKGLWGFWLVKDPAMHPWKFSGFSKTKDANFWVFSTLELCSLLTCVLTGRLLIMLPWETALCVSTIYTMYTIYTICTMYTMYTIYTEYLTYWVSSVCPAVQISGGNRGLMGAPFLCRHELQSKPGSMCCESEWDKSGRGARPSHTLLICDPAFLQSNFNDVINIFRWYKCYAQLHTLGGAHSGGEKH